MHHLHKTREVFGPMRSTDSLGSWRFLLLSLRMTGLFFLLFVFFMYEMSSCASNHSSCHFMNYTKPLSGFFFEEGRFFRRRIHATRNENHLSNNAFHKNNAWIHISLHLHIISFNRQNQLDFPEEWRGMKILFYSRFLFS